MAAGVATETARIGTARRRVSDRAALWLGRLAVPAILVVAWVLAARSSTLVPSFGATVSALVNGFSDGWVLAPLGDTMRAVLGGFAVAAAVGVPLGVVLGRRRFVGDVLDPLLTGTFAVPRVIIYPLLLAMFGVSLSAKLWMGAISAFFPIVMSTTAGVREVPPTLVKLGRSLNCGRLTRIRKLYLPAAAPTVMAGLRIGFSISFISVIIAEFFATTQGLGRVVQRSYAFEQLPRMFAVVLLIAIIAFAGNLVLWWLERRLRATVT
jgi:NitT/TauT family transport system permease protein